jgi:hypothetical protein
MICCSSLSEPDFPFSAPKGEAASAPNEGKLGGAPNPPAPNEATPAPVALPKQDAGFTAAPKGEAEAAAPPKLPEDATVENEYILAGVPTAGGVGKVGLEDAAGATCCDSIACQSFETTGAAAAAGPAVTPAAAILRAKSPSVGLIPCVFHGRAEAAAGFAVDGGAADVEFAAGFSPASVVFF